MKRWIPLVGVALAAAACGAAKRATPPPNPPKPPTLPGPPAAWAETHAGSRWLGFSTYCWARSACADYGLDPPCPDPRHKPMIQLFDKETVRFHFGFEPEAVSLTTYLKGFERPRREKLEASRAPSWTARPAELVLLTASSKRGHASYVACLEVSGSV